MESLVTQDRPHERGALTEGDVEGIRTGAFGDPPVSKAAALAAAFGVPPSYLLDRGRDPSVLDEEVLEALSDETAGTILGESSRPPEREKRIVLGIVRQFAGRPECPQSESLWRSYYGCVRAQRRPWHRRVFGSQTSCRVRSCELPLYGVL